MTGGHKVLPTNYDRLIKRILVADGFNTVFDIFLICLEVLNCKSNKLCDLVEILGNELRDRQEDDAPKA